MKLKTLAACACTAFCAISFSACGGKSIEGKSTLLGEPAECTQLSLEESRSESFLQFKSNVENFAATFAEYAYAEYDEADNFTVSPLSVFMALSLAAECADGETRSELLSALGVSYGELKENYPLLYRSLAREYREDGELVGLLAPTNSIWVNEGLPVKQPCVDALSDYYFCYSFAADFANDNAAANKAVTDFIKEQTRGLIDKNFELSEQTVFTLINTIYLKSIWSGNGDGLSFTPDSYAFKNADGSETRTKLLSGYYNDGRVYSEESFSAFYTTTYNGYKLKFILPNDGYTVDDVFTAENIQKVNACEYETYDEQENAVYQTRCLFPEYKCSYDGYIKDILNKYYGIDRLFKNPANFGSDGCDYSNLTDVDSYCSDVRHVTTLTVDKTGIEGAAVTVIENVSSSEPPKYVFADFIVNGAFGFIITDASDTTVFSGVVKTV